MKSHTEGKESLLRLVFPWPLVPAAAPLTAWLASAGMLLALAASRLAMLANGPWEQDEALLACGVVDFDPGHHMPLPPGFPLWILIGRLGRLVGIGDPLVALQVASAILSVIGVWALVGLWDRFQGRAVALSGALLAAFIPGVWFHAPRAFSGTPSAALVIVALALWVRGGTRGFVPGVIAMTAAALVRPPLAPFHLIAILLAAWAIRRDVRKVLLGGVASLALVVAVCVPTVIEAGGWRPFLGAGETHAVEHFTLLGSEGWSWTAMGYVRGLVGPGVAVVFSVLVLLGWFAGRRSLGRWWAPGTFAAAWLLYLLLFVHNHTYPRYWVIWWLLAATPAVAGAAVLLRRRAIAAGLAVLSAAAFAAWTWPAMLAVHDGPLPPVAGLRTVAANGSGVVVFADELFSFRNYVARAGRLEMASMRLTEIGERATVGGTHIWLLTEDQGHDLRSPSSDVWEFTCRQPRVRQLSQERFLHVRLVRDPILVWRGGANPETEGSRRFIWCGAQCDLLLPPMAGPGMLELAAEVQPRLSPLGVTVRVGGVQAYAGTVSGSGVFRVPIPDLPDRFRLHQMVPVEIRAEREIQLPGDTRALALRFFAASVAAPPYRPRPYDLFAEPVSLLDHLASATGFFGPELMGNPLRPAAWTGGEARVDLPVSFGRVGVELLAPRPGPVDVELDLGSAHASVQVGPYPVSVVLPVDAGLAAARRGALTIRANTFVPGGGDTRELGVAVGRVWFIPSPALTTP